MRYIYKVSCLGRYFSQRILNVLYLADLLEVIPDNTTAVSLRAAIGSQLGAVLQPAYMHLPTEYTLEGFDIRVFDEDGNDLDFAPVNVPAAINGQQAQHAGGGGDYAVLRFELNPISGLGLNAPRKGYLAFGPVSEIHVEEDGAVDFGPGSEAQIVDAFANTWATGIDATPGVELILQPARVNKVPGPTSFAFTGTTLIATGQIRPFVSSRRSRRIPPKGAL